MLVKGAIWVLQQNCLQQPFSAWRSMGALNVTTLFGLQAAAMEAKTNIKGMAYITYSGIYQKKFKHQFLYFWHHNIFHIIEYNK